MPRRVRKGKTKWTARRPREVDRNGRAPRRAAVAARATLKETGAAAAAHVRSTARWWARHQRRKAEVLRGTEDLQKWVAELSCPFCLCTEEDPAPTVWNFTVHRCGHGYHQRCRMDALSHAWDSQWNHMQAILRALNEGGPHPGDAPPVNAVNWLRSCGFCRQPLANFGSVSVSGFHADGFLNDRMHGEVVTPETLAQGPPALARAKMTYLDLCVAGVDAALRAMDKIRLGTFDAVERHAATGEEPAYPCNCP